MKVRTQHDPWGRCISFGSQWKPAQGSTAGSLVDANSSINTLRREVQCSAVQWDAASLAWALTDHHPSVKEAQASCSAHPSAVPISIALCSKHHNPLSGLQKGSFWNIFNTSVQKLRCSSYLVTQRPVVQDLERNRKMHSSETLQHIATSEEVQLLHPPSQAHVKPQLHTGKPQMM